MREYDRRRAAAAAEAEAKSAGLPWNATRAEVNRRIVQLRAELVELNRAWEAYYAEFPAAYANRTFRKAISDRESELADLMVRVALGDYGVGVNGKGG